MAIAIIITDCLSFDPSRTACSLKSHSIKQRPSTSSSKPGFLSLQPLSDMPGPTGPASTAECVKVVVRCRPLNSKEVAEGRQRIVDVDTALSQVNKLVNLHVCGSSALAG